jgi:hypothetical protein
MRVAAGLFMYNQTRRLQEIYGWVDEALALPGAPDHRLQAAAALHGAYGRYMRGAPAAAEREIQAVLDVLDDDDRLRPMALSWLAAATASAGRMDEAAPLFRTTLAHLEQLGASFDYDRAEALWNSCTMALATGAPDYRASARVADVGP